LPGGAVITSKNTLQTFDTNDATNQPKPTDAPVYQPDEVKLSQVDSPNPETTPSPATVVAVAVETDIIFAEIAPEPVFSTISMDHNDSPSDIPPLLPWYRRRSIIAMMMIVAIALALGLGLYYGLGTSDNTIRAAYLTSYINNITFTNRTITPNDESPENKALKWMINNDKTLEISAMIDLDDPYSTRFLRFRIRQRYPLLTMWFQQTKTTKWDNVAEWLKNPNECYWFRISCENVYVAYPDEYNFDSYGEYQNAVTQVSLNLFGSYVGTVPPDIGLLSSLKHFAIKAGKSELWQGSLPISIGQWTALTYFDVRDSAYNGTLPANIVQWTDLTYFDVSGNYFTGTIPENIGQWASLTHFDLYACAGLTGTLPENIGKWTALTYFDVGYNSLNGTLPNSIGQWTALTYFVAAGNSVSGKLPNITEQWTALTHFDVRSNSFTGTLPDSIGQWTALSYFDVSTSRLTGTLPDSIGQWTALTSFTVSDNGLTGPLPDNIGQWTALVHFDISSNNLNYTIPSTIGNWSLIETADFHGNELVGSIPDSICQYFEKNTVTGIFIDHPYVSCKIKCTCCVWCTSKSPVSCSNMCITESDGSWSCFPAPGDCQT
jgi:hypothetical protein